MEMRKRLGPLTAVDHAALVHLCEHKKFIHRNDGYGTESETVISTASANTLKKRELAVTGWSREMYPTKSGMRFNPRSAAALYALGRPYGQGASRDEKRTSAHAVATLARDNKLLAGSRADSERAYIA